MKDTLRKKLQFYLKFFFLGISHSYKCHLCIVGQGDVTLKLHLTTGKAKSDVHVTGMGRRYSSSK